MSTLILFEDLHDALSSIWLGRFYATTLPKVPSYPCGVYTVLAGEAFLTLCGPSDLTRFRIRVDCFAKDYREVIGHRDSVIESMMRFKYQNEKVSEFEMYEDAVDVYRKMLDFSVYFNELAAGPAAANRNAKESNHGRLQVASVLRAEHADPDRG